MASYRMRAYHNASPVGYIYWNSPGAPDYAGSLAEDQTGYPVSELERIRLAGVNESAGSALADLLFPGAGYPLKLTPTTSVAQAEFSFPLALPFGIVPVKGHKYRISGVFMVRVAGVLICATYLRDAVVKYVSSDWVSISAGDLGITKGVDYATVYASDDYAPTLGAKSGALCMFTGPTIGDADYEFDGTISDSGLDTTP